MKRFLTSADVRFEALNLADCPPDALDLTDCPVDALDFADCPADALLTTDNEDGDGSAEPAAAGDDLPTGVTAPGVTAIDEGLVEDALLPLAPVLELLS